MRKATTQHHVSGTVGTGLACGIEVATPASCCASRPSVPSIWYWQVSAGGLVSALMGVGNFQARWIGWPGVYVEDGFDRDALTDALAAENYIPVYLDANTVCSVAYLSGSGAALGTARPL